jgi:hypothetical protein
VNFDKMLLERVDLSEVKWLYIKVCDKDGREIAEWYPELSTNGDGSLTLHFAAPLDEPRKQE